jgi:adenylosuccinate lyase
MASLFSEEFRYRTWRKLWVALAEAEHELGIAAVTPAQIAALRRFVDVLNLDRARELERTKRHEVMAHILAYGEQVPEARGIIHLGSTSAYVMDNTDLIQLREGLRLLRRRIVNVLVPLARFARTHASVVTLGYTHLQPAQFTTAGKRACLWIQDLLLDLRDLDHQESEIRFLGAKGATGTQASFLELFGGDAEKVRRLDELVTKKMGFESAFRVTGQTYPRKADTRAVFPLVGIAQSTGKFGNDVRLLSAFGEAEEPFEAEQIGSSAMAYKKNPMRSERMNALSRLLTTLAMNPPLTAAAQWFERTLDDSANRRLALPEMFLCADALLLIYRNVAEGLTLHPRVIARRVRDELPFIATEDLLMMAVKGGGDRQELHERIRRHSIEAARRVKEDGAPNDLFERIESDAAFAAIRSEIASLRSPERFAGRAVAQVDEFLTAEVDPLLVRHNALIEPAGERDVRV